MSEKKDMLKFFAETAFARCFRAFQDLTEKEIEWRPVTESNNIKWILVHLSTQWNVGIPRMIKGNAEYKPVGWPDDYSKINHQFSKLFADLEKGKASILTGIDSLKDKDLESEIDLGRGPRKRLEMITNYLFEAVQHSGQITMLKGDIKRRREKEPNFLK